MAQDRHYALAREAILAALTAYTGITTADGATPANNTLICADLIDENNFITNKMILIGSGDAMFEDKGASSFDDTIGEITVGSGFSAQIKKGTIFRVLNISSVEIDVAAIEAKLDTIDGIVDAILLDTDTTIPGLLATIAGYIDPKVMGRLQMASASWDGRPGEGAGSDALLTATTQAVVVEAVIVVMAAAPDLTDDPWTGISIEDDYATTPHTFIPAADGVKANLTANAQLAWTGSVYLAVGQAIQATAIGDDADEDASITVIVLYRAVVSGGYLA